MTTAYGACPFCGLRGCASPLTGAEAVSPELLAQLRRALAVSVVPEVVPDLPGAAAAVTRPRPSRWRRRPEQAARSTAVSVAPSPPAVATG